MTALSVVVPTYNRWEQLRTALSALAAQSVPARDVEVVVVSDGSSDGTDEHLRAGNAPLDVTFLSQENQGVASARNAGIAAARGELIVFIDDDVVAEPECLAAHLDAHESAPRETVVIGPLLTPPDIPLEPWVRWEQHMLYKQYDAMARGDYPATARQFYTGNASLSRARLVSSGGFDTSFRRAEDVELAYRLDDLGLEFVFDRDARAFHHASRSYESWLANAHAYGRNDVIFWRDRGQRWLLPEVRAEYGRRNPLTRAFTRLGIALPAFGRAACSLAPRWAGLVDRAGLDGGGRRVLSAVYNLAYYQSLTSELGGVRSFLRADDIDQGHSTLQEEPHAPR